MTSLQGRALKLVDAIRSDVSKIGVDLHDLKVRMSGVEQNTGVMNGRMDRIEERLVRIEQRLDVADA